MSDSAVAFRRIERFRMEMERGPKRLCDLCGVRPGTDMHEIVARSRTLSNPAARRASYHRFLCAWLCRSCHSKAHNQAVGQELLGKNIERYGRAPVKQAYDQVNDLTAGSIIPFPEEHE